MSPRFSGWSEAAQRFFIGLELDNSRSYFESHRQSYLDDVRAPMEALLAELEPEFGPGKIFRINRDLRFSADKTPYKTHIAATCGAGYVHLSARDFYVGAGRYHLEGDGLRRYRQAVAAGPTGAELAGLVAGLEAMGIEIGGETLRQVPAGFPRDHPRAGLLKRKGVVAIRGYGLEPWLGTAEAKDRVAEVWRAAQPLTAWLGRYAG